jgi:murein L,D-transpeptidase YcbB/YkuD
LARLDGKTHEQLDFSRKSLKPGMTHPNVKLLRARMDVEGNSDVYDDTLVKKVIAFQESHGLKSDGSIGPETLKLLNRSPEEEKAQIIVNMQRLREPHRRVREPRRIEVSIARYWLTGFDEGQSVIEMPVIVGKPTRQTISFRTEISGVRLNPTWTAPATIKREDFIPMLVTDPAKLVSKYGVKVVQGGLAVDPMAVEWAKMPPEALAQVKFWVPSGDNNPLGRYRVIMENPYDIYLHDTNHPDLFANAMRAQSSGCVRVAKPEALANFILSFKQGWNPQKTEKIVKSGRTHNEYMENKIPIYLDYMTAWRDSHNQVVLGVDVYELDKPRYNGMVKNVLTTQRNTQRILNRITEILNPPLQEAQHRETVLTQSSN